MSGLFGSICVFHGMSEAQFQFALVFDVFLLKRRREKGPQGGFVATRAAPRRGVGRGRRRGFACAQAGGEPPPRQAERKPKTAIRAVIE